MSEIEPVTMSYIRREHTLLLYYKIIQYFSEVEYRQTLLISTESDTKREKTKTEKV